MADIKDFLNPTSMLTPGVAGGLTVTISMPLVIQFDMSFKWVALVTSFLFSLIVVFSSAQIKSKLLQGIYCILNTLIIFSVSVGAGVTIDPPRKPPSLAEINRSNYDFDTSRSFSFMDLGKILFVSIAFADPPGNSVMTNETSKVKKEPALQSDAESPPSEKISTDSNNCNQLSLEEQIKKLEIEKKEAEEHAKKEEDIRKIQKQKIIEYEKYLKDYYKRWSW